MLRGLRSAPRGGASAAIADALLALGAASLIVAVVAEFAPAASLTIVYLLAVLFVAVRRGSWVALATSALGVVLFNFLFIEPRFTLGVASSGDLVTLALFLIVSLVVGRLAATARSRSEQAEEAHSMALAREREARILAQTASAVLALGDQPATGRAAVEAVASALPAEEDTGLRIAIDDFPQDPGSCVVPLDVQGVVAWLRGSRGAGWDPQALERLTVPLTELCGLVRERASLRKQQGAAEAAVRAEAAKTALLHAVSHDLRSPLTAISTAASAMSPGRLPDRDHVALLEVIREESGRLARLVDDLLDVSRIEAAAVEPNKDWCHVNEVAARAVVSVRRRTDHPIELALPDDVLLVHADSVQLERVLVNLLDNAVKHSPEGSSVRLSGGVGGGQVHVRVTDKGRGIPLSKRREVFEPFFRGRSSEGSGLGLTICRGFTEANGGAIRIADAEGGGTSIAVSFPLATQPSSP